MLRRTAPAARAAIPQAATAANIASALTHCQIAAGPKTRNGAALRATTSAPSSRSVTSTASAVEAASSVTTTPAHQPLPSPIRSSTTKKPSAPGGWPATCTGQFAFGMSSGRPSYGMRAIQPARIPWKSVVARAVRRYSYSVSRIFETPSRPSTKARLNSHATPPAYDAASRPRHGNRCASATDHQTASPPTSRAGIVPGPRPGIPVGVQRREVPHVHVPVGQRRQRHRERDQPDPEGQARERCDALGPGSCRPTVGTAGSRADLTGGHAATVRVC